MEIFTARRNSTLPLAVSPASWPIAPPQALFLDDKKVNTEGAKRVGMQSYVFHSAVDPVMQTGGPEITVAELRALLLDGR